jgi:hypothetical protein
MDPNFDIFVKEHLAEIFCQVTKERGLRMLLKTPHSRPIQALRRLPHRHRAREPHLCDCSIEASFSHNHL